MSAALRRRLIVNADDFGRSSSINQAIIRAHREGILTTASLMVAGQAFAEAVELARQTPSLGIGLHLTLICGMAVLPPRDIPDLVNEEGRFSSNPVVTGFRYFGRKELRAQLRAEIAAQFDKFHATGLALDHVNGHLHLHLHPVVFRILVENAPAWRIGQMRWSYDPFWLNLRLARGRWLYRLGHGLVVQLLCPRTRPVLDRRGLRHTERVFGMLQDGRVDEKFVLKLLAALPAGDSELYSHPSLDQFKHEFEALVSPAVAASARKLEIQLIRYQDL